MQNLSISTIPSTTVEPLLGDTHDVLLVSLKQYRMFTPDSVDTGIGCVPGAILCSALIPLNGLLYLFKSWQWVFCHWTTRHATSASLRRAASGIFAVSRRDLGNVPRRIVFDVPRRTLRDAVG